MELTPDGAEGVISGVPQWSFWVPIVYDDVAIHNYSMICHKTSTVYCNIKQYAVDSKLYTTVKEDKYSYIVIPTLSWSDHVSYSMVKWLATFF